jgi:hypothetical protein
MQYPNDKLMNLVRIGQLKTEPPDQREIDGLVGSAGRRLIDAQNASNASDSRFSLAYDAAHSLALAALRWHGFRPSNRYVVFQALPHTLDFPGAKWRLLSDCHQKRNAALYDGDMADDEQLIKELVAITTELERMVIAMGPIAV